MRQYLRHLQQEEWEWQLLGKPTALHPFITNINRPVNITLEITRFLSGSLQWAESSFPRAPHGRVTNAKGRSHGSSHQAEEAETQPQERATLRAALKANCPPKWRVIRTGLVQPHGLCRADKSSWVTPEQNFIPVFLKHHHDWHKCSSWKKANN